ncbi:MAG: glutamine--fructose-6-phosphate transaminase (isomerizing) [Haloferacaceae archaeon]
MSALDNLEYRGYDSAGIAVRSGRTGAPSVFKTEGDIDRLRGLVGDEVTGTVGIGHTRWSTHGPPSDENAHPHTDCHGDVAVVHNGIIENHEQLREELRTRGHRFTSDTDTEVVPHLVEEHRDAGMNLAAAFRAAVARLEGSYAVAMLADAETTVYAARRGSPLVVGVGDDRRYLASDVPAFLEYTDRVIYLDDGQVVAVGPDDCEVTTLSGRAVDPTVESVDWDPEDTGKGRFDHYMLKEIHEQPEALAQSVQGRIADDGTVALDDFPGGSFDDVTELQLVGCGTSYHAARYAVELARRRGVRANAFLASEYAASPPPIDDGTLVLGVTQSGETADTLEAIRAANDVGADTLAVTNVVGSTATRVCDRSLFIRAGPEIGVAATKTFSSQLATLSLLLEAVARDVPAGTPAGPAFLDAVCDLPDAVAAVLDGTSTAEIAATYADYGGYFFVGRNTGYTVALEAALKFKEITYEHAEGFAAGELKHGPLALVTEETPVFGILADDTAGKTRHNLQEVRARGAPIVAVTSDPTAVRDVADHVVRIPETHPDLAGVLANVQLQLLAYHAAAHLERAIDKPRNLAKSVTVE